MAKFIKKDGKPVNLVKKTPAASETSVTGRIEEFVSQFDHQEREHKILITLSISEAESLGGLAPVIFTGGKVRITLLTDENEGLNPDRDEPSDSDESDVKEPPDDEYDSVKEESIYSKLEAEIIRDEAVKLIRTREEERAEDLKRTEDWVHKHWNDDP